ncbi:hypothetical protein Droror1_Dr00019713 [Drosera rotundifolia]
MVNEKMKASIGKKANIFVIHSPETKSGLPHRLSSISGWEQNLESTPHVWTRATLDATKLQENDVRRYLNFKTILKIKLSKNFSKLNNTPSKKVKNAKLASVCIYSRISS